MLLEQSYASITQQNNSKSTSKNAIFTPYNQKSSHNIVHPLNHDAVLIKQECPKCHQKNRSILFYECCLEVACQACFTNQHFSTCHRLFNKHVLTLTEYSSSTFMSCSRCLSTSKQYEFCLECKQITCRLCAELVHSKAKYSLHERTPYNCDGIIKAKNNKISSDCVNQDKINLQSLLEKNNLLKENLQYGFKASSKIRNKSISPNKTKIKSKTSTPVLEKSNQDRNSHRDHQIVSKVENISTISELNFFKQKPINEITPQSNQLMCVVHLKKRNILTETFELICQSCLETHQQVITKIKTICLEPSEINLSKNANEQQNKRQLPNLLQQITESLHSLIRKQQENQSNFTQMKHQVKQQYEKKRQMLDERYQNNSLTLGKWENNINSSLELLKNKAETIINEISCLHLLHEDQSPKKQRENDYLSDDKKINSKLLENIYKIKLNIALEEIKKGKKDLNLEGYLYKINYFSENFDEAIKGFSVTRKKCNQQNQGSNARYQHNSSQKKSAMKYSQSNHLKLSRMSNTSVLTDRKKQLTKRQDSVKKYQNTADHKSILNNSQTNTHHQINTLQINKHSQMNKNSQGKYKHQIKKQISSRLLFTSHNAVSTQRHGSTKNQKNNCSIVNKNKEECKDKQKEISYSPFRDIKYLDLEDFKKIQSSKQKQNIVPEMDISLTEGNVIELSKGSERNSTISMAESITVTKNAAITQSTLLNPCFHQNKMTIESLSFQNRKKSDYMDLRERMRKPNLISKFAVNK